MFAPLQGLHVVDVTTSIAGPYCTWILAALGADVVKIERMDGGDDARAWGPPFWNGESAAFLAMNASKRSVAVDLKASEGLEVVRRLAMRADVFVQNLRPGTVEQLGLGFRALASSNDRLVYCSVGAFGHEGPLRTEPGYDPLMQAYGGLMSITGEPNRPPARSGASIIDQGTGMWAAIAILAALRERDASGAAQLIETSLYETAVNWVANQLVGTTATGIAPGPLGSSIGFIAPYQAFETRDGWLMVAAGNDRLFRALCEVLALHELASDARFGTNRGRVEHRDELAELLSERFGLESSGHWLERLRAAGVPAAPVQDLAEVLDDEQTKALGLLQEMPHPQIADLRIVRPPLSVDSERIRLTSPPPVLGEHTHEVLRELGYSERELDALAAAGTIA